MKIFIYIYFCCFCVLFPTINGWRMFHLGRSVGGNLGLPGSSQFSASESVKTLWFNQILDHFNPVDGRTWKQRYYVNDNFYDVDQGGPVFLMIGGEGEATVEWMTQGAWIDYAKKFGALCFQVEHRFYGKSHPTSDLSTKNLVYLSSEQALADLANFITSINEQYKLPADQKWIAFGGSYPGSLAAWLRLKYPHLVHASVSTSGPLLAVADFQDYFNVVVDSLRTSSDECVDIIANATGHIEDLLKTLNGKKTISQLFQLCSPIEDSTDYDNDVANFFESLAGNFAGIVQYNKDNRIGKSSTTKNITIDTLCGILTDEGNSVTSLQRLADVNSFLLTAYNQSCLDYTYKSMIDSLRNTSWDNAVAEGGRQWTYQTCTEFGFYQTSSGNQVFGHEFPVEFFTQQCSDIYGPKYNASLLAEAIERSNTIYGALDIQVSNVVFVHGSIDPWHALGITKTLEQNAPAIYINGTAHCANMYPPQDSDLPGLKQARVEIASLIDQWLSL